ncbi:MAG: hypothetical protein AUI36_36675 [Cyanobacteria bacterium 13_1_40CM_2_61_4]|nr:MAG: hypothetical protein AUI36_36675 [Cyanobacteria bacterium 13_1_40CM_2_61_4]
MGLGDTADFSASGRKLDTASRHRILPFLLWVKEKGDGCGALDVEHYICAAQLVNYPNMVQREGEGAPQLQDPATLAD